MTTHNEAFEKWWANNYSNLDHRDILRTSEKAWQAAKADSEREIAELKERLNEVAADWQVKHYQIEALKADNVIMRDALNKIALGYVNDADIIESAGDCLQRLSATPAQEPVAWMIWWDDREWLFTGDREDFDDAIKSNFPITPLYTHPAQPLSDDEINVFINPMPQNIQNDDLREFARAIEKAHGIGE